MCVGTGETVTRSPVLDHPGDHGQAHLEALGELEFRKQFLILSYAGGYEKVCFFLSFRCLLGFVAHLD